MQERMQLAGICASGSLGPLILLITPEALGRHQREARNAYDVGQRLHTFSIGIAGSPDLAAARDVAVFLSTQHHEYTFTVDEGIDALYDLIYHIESFEQARPPAPVRSLTLTLVMLPSPTSPTSVTLVLHADQLSCTCASWKPLLAWGAPMYRRGVTCAGALGGADVPAVQEDQGGGLQGGAERGGRRRGVRRLPLLPQGALAPPLPRVRPPSRHRKANQFLGTCCAASALCCRATVGLGLVLGVMPPHRRRFHYASQ